MSERAAAGLAALGLKPGDRVALLLGNCLEFVISFMACNRLGLICVPIGTRHKRPELEFLLNDCGVTTIIFETEFSMNVPISPAVPKLRHRFYVGDPVEGAEAFAKLLATGGSVAHHRVEEEDTAFILYTSGTTGRPKGAMLTNIGVIHSSLTFGRCLGLTHVDRSVIALPISHVTGLVGIFLAVACVGGCNILMRAAYKTPAFLALAARERMSYTIAVPAIYTLCVSEPNFASYDLSGWRDWLLRGCADAGCNYQGIGGTGPGIDADQLVWSN